MVNCTVSRPGRVTTLMRAWAVGSVKSVRSVRSENGKVGKRESEKVVCAELTFLLSRSPTFPLSLLRRIGSIAGCYLIAEFLFLARLERQDEFHLGGVHLLVGSRRGQSPITREIAADVEDYVDVLGVLHFEVPALLSRPAFHIAVVVKLKVGLHPIHQGGLDHDFQVVAQFQFHLLVHGMYFTEVRPTNA